MMLKTNCTDCSNPLGPEEKLLAAIFGDEGLCCKCAERRRASKCTVCGEPTELSINREPRCIDHIALGEWRMHEGNTKERRKSIMKQGAKHPHRIYTSSEKDEVLDAYQKGMKVPEICKIREIPTSTVRTWLTEAGLTPKKKVQPAQEPVPLVEDNHVLATVPSVRKNQTTLPAPTLIRLSLDDFLGLLKALVVDYELTKAKLHEMEKSVERWRRIAGNLNEQLNM